MIKRLVVLSMACTVGALGQVPPEESDPAAALRGRYADLNELLEQSPIQRGLYLESAESSRFSRGDVYAVVDFGFATISDTFTRPENWCEALILHLNVKYCRVIGSDERPVLSVAIGKKTEQPLKQTRRVEFTYEITAMGPDYTQIVLGAKKGPLGTKNYHILLELIALDSRTHSCTSVMPTATASWRDSQCASILGKAAPRWDSRGSKEPKVVHRISWAACVVRWSATRCATTRDSGPGPFRGKPGSVVHGNGASRPAVA